MQPERPSTLSQAELLRLEQFLRSQSSGEAAMSLSRAHGFLSAIVSGPEQFEAGEWIRLICDEPVFSDAMQAEDVLGLIMRLHTDIEQRLQQPGRYNPVFEFIRGPGGGERVSAREWCEGFLSAMALWSVPLPRTLRQTLEPLFLIAGARGPVAQQLPDAHYTELSAMLPAMVETVYRHWHH